MDDELFMDNDMIPDDGVDDEDLEYGDVYDDKTTEEDFRQLFGDSDDEDFLGFSPSDIRDV